MAVACETIGALKVTGGQPCVSLEQPELPGEVFKGEAALASDGRQRLKSVPTSPCFKSATLSWVELYKNQSRSEAPVSRSAALSS